MAKEFFLGSNSAEGFFSLFDELYSPRGGWHAYLIKGGPGTGKSTLMKRIAAEIEKDGFAAEYIFCASDPDSLDAVIFPELLACVADATPPHAIEPQYPGAVEDTVDLSAFWNKDLLKKYSRRIINVTDYNRSLHRRAARFFAAAGALEGDSRTISKICTDVAKTERYALRFVAREMGNLSPRKGTETRRFVSAVTPDGFVIKESGIAESADRIIAVCDEYGGSSALLLGFLRRSALAAGHDVVSCLNPMFPKDAEALIFPGCRIAFVTADRRHDFEAISTQRIHARRFLDTDALSERRQRLSFNKKASAELYSEGIALLKRAKSVHDELEKFYVDAMDFSFTDPLVKNISGAIRSAAP